jgi:hypothetical protein
MHQKILTIFVFISFLVLFSSANALIVYLRPPKMIIRLNTSESVERELTIENRNNVSMQINATIQGNISEVITIKNPSFEILGNETKTIDFVAKAKNPGVYSGEIIVTYNTDVLRPVTIPSEITVIATKNPSPEFNIFPALTAILIFLFILVVAYKVRKR